ncbi:MAG: hypothetical protein ICV85_11650 [Tolypothrix sp. T3-bin4]|nr:hypothetical protein [Tolypothrix sp. T3-bin4]
MRNFKNAIAFSFNQQLPLPRNITIYSWIPLRGNLTSKPAPMLTLIGTAIALPTYTNRRLKQLQLCRILELLVEDRSISRKTQKFLPHPHEESYIVPLVEFTCNRGASHCYSRPKN